MSDGPEAKQDDSFQIVKLSQRDLQDASRLLSTIVTGVPQTGSVVFQPSSPSKHRDMVRRARRTFLNRKRRSELFESSLFGEPAWDMLLALYINEDAGPRSTIGRLIAFCGLSMTTGLRWLDALENNRLIERNTHPTDKRVVLISLSEEGRDALNAYFSETGPEGT